MPEREPVASETRFVLADGRWRPEPAESSTPSPQLRRALGFRDLLAFYIVTTFSLRWIATAAAAGPSALVIWIIAARRAVRAARLRDARVVVALSGRRRHLCLEQARLRTVLRRS